jgi:methylmalonyl-CoA mutase
VTHLPPTDHDPFPLPTPDHWRTRVEKELGGADFEKTLVSHLPGGVETPPLFTRPPGETDPSGFPGLWPNTRGAEALGRSEEWEIVVAGDPSPERDELRDPLANLARDGTLPGSLEGEFVEMAKRVREIPSAVGISTVVYHDAGAHPIEELGLALATGLEYLRRLEKEGIEPREAAGRIVFRFAVDRDIFVEIAKLRAARLAWSRLLAACGAADAPPMRIHVETSSRSLSRRDPWTNMLRVTTEVFAAICAGADTIIAAPFDQALGVPEELGRRIARNTGRILREESHLGRVIDPAGGSWYVEELTQRLARGGWDEMREIEKEGGMARALLSGEIGRRVAESAEEREARLATRKLPVTGVSEYPDVDELLVREAPAPRPRLPLRPEPDGDAPRIDPFLPRRDAAPFEALRDAADAAVTRPSIFLANLGPPPEHRARTGFAQNFFRVAGFEILSDDGTGEAGPTEAAEALAKRFRSSGASIACLCGTDERYGELALEVARSLTGAGAKRILFAGRGGKREAQYREAGIETFIHVGCDIIDILSSLLATCGIAADGDPKRNEHLEKQGGMA